MSKQNETSEFLPPVQFQNGESVRLRLGRHTDLPCRILATKSTAKFIYYDLEVWLYSLPEKAVEPEYTRLYHVESKFVFEREPIGDEPDSTSPFEEMADTTKPNQTNEALAMALEATAESLSLMASKHGYWVPGAPDKNDRDDIFGCHNAIQMADDALKSFRKKQNTQTPDSLDMGKLAGDLLGM